MFLTNQLIRILIKLNGYIRFLWIIVNSTIVILVHSINMIFLSPLFWFGGEKGKIWYWMAEEMFYEWILYILDFTISSLDYKIVETLPKSN